MKEFFEKIVVDSANKIAENMTEKIIGNSNNNKKAEKIFCSEKNYCNDFYDNGNNDDDEKIKMKNIVAKRDFEESHFYQPQENNMQTQNLQHSQQYQNSQLSQSMMQLQQNPQNMQNLQLLPQNPRQNYIEHDIGVINAFSKNKRLSLMVIGAAFGLLFCLIVLTTYKENLPGEVVGIISTIAGIFGACLKDAYSFEFGNSRESSKSGGKENADRISKAILERLKK